MKKFDITFTLAALLILPLVFLSCSGDSGNNNEKKISQEQATQMQSIAASLAPLTGMATGAGMTHVDGVEEGDFDLSEYIDTGEGYTVILEYLDATGWWDGYFSFEYEPDADTSMSLTVRDSIRFEDTDGLAQQAPDETTDLMRNILSLALLADINGLGMIDLSLHSDMTYSNLASDVVTVNGDGSFDFDMDVETEDGSISGNVSATLDINDLTIPKPSFEGEMTCPTSGEIVLMVTENLTAQAVNEGVISVTWKLTVTVLSGNSYKIKLEGGGQNFGEVTINDACSESLSLTNRFPTSVTGVMKSFDPQR